MGRERKRNGRCRENKGERGMGRIEGGEKGERWVRQRGGEVEERERGGEDKIKEESTKRSKRGERRVTWVGRRERRKLGRVEGRGD